ncbi:MAG: hypothetical protein KDB22_14150 [Planctomycetales bacterium]|nr:hypothetical protein [Planctomycetales bacterium]
MSQPTPESTESNNDQYFVGVFQPEAVPANVVIPDTIRLAAIRSAAMIR